MIIKKKVKTMKKCQLIICKSLILHMNISLYFFMYIKHLNTTKISVWMMSQKKLKNRNVWFFQRNLNISLRMTLQLALHSNIFSQKIIHNCCHSITVIFLAICIIHLYCNQYIELNIRNFLFKWNLNYPLNLAFWFWFII